MQRARLRAPLIGRVLRRRVIWYDLWGPRAGQPTLRLGQPALVSSNPPHPQPLCVQLEGFNLHAAVSLDGCDRRRLERLCRYLARGPLSNERLSLCADGRLRYTLKRRWADGTTAVVLNPLDLLARLAALVPPPRFHLLRFAGVFAGHHAMRSAIVPKPYVAPPAAPRQLSLFVGDEQALPCMPAQSSSIPRRRLPWLSLLKRVFAIDLSVCSRCGFEPIRVRGIVTDREAIHAVLARHGLGARAPAAPIQFPGQLALRF